MKKVLVTLALLIGIVGFAQHKGHRGAKKDALKDMTTEQVATLQTKKMALALDLTEAQQEQLMALNVENAEYRKAKLAEREAKKEKGELSKPTADERFAMQNARLDRQLAQQAKLKQILSEEQYALWKKLSYSKHMHNKKRIAQSRRG